LVHQKREDDSRYAYQHGDWRQDEVEVFDLDMIAIYMGQFQPFIEEMGQPVLGNETKIEDRIYDEPYAYRRDAQDDQREYHCDRRFA
jgi:hypothetical protein